MKKTFILLIISLFLFSFYSCKEKQEFEISDLTGMWVEKTLENDTIVFSNNFSTPAFEVRRGKESRGDYFQPKLGSGFYWYKIKNDSIYVNYMLSSCAANIPYHFSMNKTKNEFTVIGNFTFAPSDALVFTYKKIK